MIDTKQEIKEALEHRFERVMLDFGTYDEQVERIKERLKQVIKWREMKRIEMQELGVQVENFPK